jgi:L,D-peptidoglycan transpeptidase YkuD (ErfK/YbiS/YcfS/YnhG family)
MERRKFLASQADLAHIRQVLVVAPESGAQAVMERYERRGDGEWALCGEPWPAVIGAKGFAAHGAKREGDLKTPAGLFRIDHAFGYAPRGDTRLPYRQAGADDKFIDDLAHAAYNTWVHGSTDAGSFEIMRREDGLYEHGLVIHYNMDPVMPGHGSAIFIHIWPGPSGETAGCIALEKDRMVELLRWLDPAAEPHVLLHPAAFLH